MGRREGEEEGGGGGGGRGRRRRERREGEVEGGRVAIVKHNSGRLEFQGEE